MISIYKNSRILKKTIANFSFRFSYGIKLTFPNKTINDLTIFDSVFLNGSFYHNANFKHNSNILIKGTIYFLPFEGKNEELEDLNQKFQKIKQNFEELTNLQNKNAGLTSNLEIMVKEINLKKENEDLQSELLKMFGKDKILSPLISSFKKVKSSIITLLSKLETLETLPLKEPFLYNLSALTNLYLYINILDLEVWRPIILLHFNNFKEFNDNKSFSIVGKNILYFLKLFRFRLNDTSLTNKYFFYYEENEIVAILNKQMFLKVYIQIKESFQECFLIKNFKKLEAVCKDYYITYLITEKFLKSQNVDFYKLRSFCENLKFELIKNMDEISIKSVLIFYETFGGLGLNDNEIMDRFHVYFNKNIKLLEIQDDDLVIKCFLSNWKANGKYDKALFQNCLKPKILSHVKGMKKNNIFKLSGLFYDLVCMNITDPEVLMCILNKILEKDVRDFPVFNKRALHSAFQYLLTSSKISFDLTIYKDCIDKLSMFCIEINDNEIFLDQGDNFFTKKKSNLHFLDCCDFNHIKEREKKLIKNRFEQKIIQSQQERTIISWIKKHFVSNVIEKVEIFENFQVCLYKIDLVLYFKKNNEKVAFEICGNPYVLENGGLIGKKQVKFKLLENLGWKIIYFDISKARYFNMLSHFSEENVRIITEEIQLRIEEKLSRKLEMKERNEKLSEKKQIFSFKKR